MDKIKFSEIVKSARAKKNMTLYEFGEHIGTSWVTVWRWENKYVMPKKDAIEYWMKRIKQ